VTSISSETGFPGDRNPTLFVLEFNPAPGQTVQKVIAALDEEIKGIQKKGVTKEELDRARRFAESAFLWGKTTTEGLAQDLAYNQAVHGDWRYVEKYLDMVRELTTKDIRYTAMKYLINDNRIIATLERPKDKTNVHREDAKTPRKD
jgi:predicted Zn-dependent peptidase